MGDGARLRSRPNRGVGGDLEVLPRQRARPGVNRTIGVTVLALALTAGELAAQAQPTITGPSVVIDSLTRKGPRYEYT